MIANTWDAYQPEPLAVPLGTSPYVVPLLPLDFHRHTVRGVDLSDLATIQLSAIDDALEIEGVRGVLTTFLSRDDLQNYSDFSRAFSASKQRGECENIVALALEGPLLSSPGGTPSDSVWRPTKQEWRQLAAHAEHGLKYVVMSPDFDVYNDSQDSEYPSVHWIISLLLDSGISPALGHLRKDDPDASAQAIEDVFETAERRQAAPPLLSDHLFNDMPLRFRHAWRTAEQKSCRERDLALLRAEEWQLDNLDERVGPVPAALIRGAAEGRITLCLNFDGEHVDIAIAQQVVRIVGPDQIIALTDRVDGSQLAGQPLHASRDNHLMYRADGVVVASSVGLDDHVTNMRQIGVSEEDIWKMIALTPSRLLGVSLDADADGRPTRGSFVDADRSRVAFHIQ